MDEPAAQADWQRYLLLDTDVLIDVGRGDAQAVQYLEQAAKNSAVSISMITQMELIVGCRNKSELRSLDRFLRRFRIFALDEPTSRTAADLLRRYRLSHGLLIPDCLIAATAIRRGIALVSKNQRDFAFISELDLRPYP